MDGKPCRRGADLHLNTKSRDMLQIAAGQKPHTPNSCLGFEALLTRLDKSRHVMQSTFFKAQHMRRLLQLLYARLSLFDRCFAAIRSNILPRLAQILKKTMEWGRGLKRIAPLLEDAVRANRTQCGVNERHLAVLFYRVVCPTGLQALQAEKVLPSVWQCTLAKTWGIARCLANGVKEVDFMSVPNALTIIDCITEIAMADHDELDPSRHTQAKAVWSLHWVAFYARDYYFSNTLALSPRMAYAAAASGHLMALQNASAPFDEQWYCDMAEEVGEVYYNVRRRERDFPGSQYFICLRGTDPLESQFGVVGTARGQGGVLDIVQLRRKLAIATRIQEIFAHAPGYKVKRKHSSQADNMTPADEGPCSLPINLPELRQEGLCYVQRDLGIHFSNLHRAGVALLAPRGTVLKPVIRCRGRGCAGFARR